MIELKPEIKKLAEKAKNRDELKLILQENQINISDPEINELAWIMNIPHGYNCPCCMARFPRIRIQNNLRSGKKNS